jgi:hypothetical protein
MRHAFSASASFGRSERFPLSTSVNSGDQLDTLSLLRCGRPECPDDTRPALERVDGDQAVVEPTDLPRDDLPKTRANLLT